MTVCNNLRSLKRGAADARPQDEPSDYDGQSHTDALGIFTSDYVAPSKYAEYSEIDVETRLVTDALAMAMGIVALVLVAVVTVAAAGAIGIIAVALIACLRICGRRERARLEAEFGRGVGSGLPVGEAEEKDHEDKAESWEGVEL
ncbi:uncharacterized protein B0H64DRAFT_371212 [Chaetomium fimeti]|uniref:Uncharacterized protein n=1 Tax=Chaetomium fimeti TaxID=1854472 RepID=A0AAE0HM83_9PEZI|nr:hypothetical protein B0H64DRAFT_371212 [Chaetomium fimeti]